MKAISIWQPWASLLFAPGEFRKVYETRPRTMGFKPGERIAIHASKTLKGMDFYSSISSITHMPDGRMIRAALEAMYGTERSETQMPLGCIIGTVEVQHWQHTADGYWVSEQERAFGDWRAGRVAIPTREPLLFKTPIPFIGKQGVFRVDDQLIAEALVL